MERVIRSIHPNSST